MGLESGKPRILSITTTSLKKEKDLVNSVESSVTDSDES